MNNLYTSRFFVKDGRGARYYMNKPMFAPFSPSFFGVPDGCYEFYNGKAWEIKWGGTRFLLPKEHLLYQSSIENVQTLFNLGIQLNGSYAPQHKEQALYPNRYVYFRDGDLYVMGAPLFSKDDPQLKLFVEKELHKEEISNTRYSYRAFVDRGAPLRDDGSVDVEFITKYGLKVPDEMYFALGDNHSASADSRVFGFVPGENLRGSPSLIVWPFGDTWGVPQQAPYQWITLSRLVVWVIVGIVLFLYLFWQRYQRKYFVIKLDKSH